MTLLAAWPNQWPTGDCDPIRCRQSPHEDQFWVSPAGRGWGRGWPPNCGRETAPLGGPACAPT